LSPGGPALSQQEERLRLSKVVSLRRCQAGVVRRAGVRPRPRSLLARRSCCTRTHYLLRAVPTCNCYDQCSAVHVLAGAVGVHLSWLYLDPYGFIKPTNLVGVGTCNNPFFSSPRKKVVPWDDPDRSAFGNHAFPGPAGNAADACAGPHLGNETREEYLDASIDTRSELYSGTGFHPGKLKDIVTKPDVQGVE
jgi:hypothetical protein